MAKPRIGAQSSSAEAAEALARSLRNLDELLGAVLAERRVPEGPPSKHLLRGIRLTDDDAAALLSRPAGDRGQARVRNALAEGATFARLEKAFELSSKDLDILLIAFAPEVDLKYEHLYSLLQGDVTLRRPTQELILTLLAPSVNDGLLLRQRLGPGSLLIHHGLLHIEVEGPRASRLAAAVRVDEQVARFLLGDQPIDPRLARLATLEDAPRAEDVTPRIASLLASVERGTTNRIRILCEGPERAEARRLANGIAAQQKRPTLRIDLGAATTDAERQLAIERAIRCALISNAVLMIELPDATDDGEEELPGSAMMLPKQVELPIVVWRAREGLSFVGQADFAVVRVEFPDVSTRVALWKKCLDEKAIRLDDRDVRQLASVLRLTEHQIRAAAAAAADDRDLGGGIGRRTELAMIRDAIAGQATHGLERMARRITPRHTMDDLVAPEDCKRQIDEVCARVLHRHDVLHEGGFGEKLSTGLGTSVLLSGPPGVGKTLVAEIIAGRLGLPLYELRIAALLSKWIGESERRIERVFDAAKDANAVLFFDEADGLFSRRVSGEDVDSRDRHANILTNQLLLKLDQFTGVVLLATNLRGNLDPAFVRRLTFTLFLPVPSEEERRRIWERIWPPEITRADDVDAGKLAREYALTGGNIRNAALSAAYLAQEDKEPVTLDHVRRAISREHEKMGRRHRAEAVTATG